MKRADAERQIAQDLTDLKRPDLVAHSFKDVLPVELGARILLVFLQLGVIQAREIVPAGGISLAQTGDGWISVCLQAALDLHAKYTSAAKPAPQVEKSSRIPAKYSWTWSSKIESDECKTSEEKAATFFNVVGTLAFLVACQLDPTFKDRYRYRNRFAALPYVNRNIVGVYGQEFRVDIFSLPLRAFRPNDLTDLGEACTPSTSPINVIRKNLNGSLQASQSPPSPVGTSTSSDPCLLIPPPSPQSSSPSCPLLPPSHAPSTPRHDTHASQPSPAVIANVLPPASQSPCISTFTPPSVASLSQPPANPPLGVQDTSFQSPELLKQALKEQLNAPFKLSIDFAPDLDSQYLLNKYACFQGFGITGKAKSQDSREAIEQELVYMQQHGMAQPHLQFVLGVAKTDTEITFIRADAIGTEEVTLDGRVGSDVLEIIRLTLGLGVATSQMLGAHPGFELSDDREILTKLKENTPVVASMDTRDGQAQSIPTSDFSSFATDSETSGGKRKRGSTIANSNKQPRPTPPLDYWAPSPVFFRIDDRRYFLDHLAQGRRSITGRQTRVWCAYLELKAEDVDRLEGKGDRDHTFPSIHEDDMAEAKALLASGSKVFVGPYALKIQYADIDSPAMANGIVETIRDQIQQDPERGKYLLAPEWEHRGHEVITAVRGFQSVPSTVKNRYLRWQELVSVSLFKRTLDHYRSLGEVCRAVVDGYRAILWLRNRGFFHRDLSNGDLLLAREQPTTFTGPSKRAVKVGGCEEEVTLVRQRLHDPKDVFGLVHDLDMAPRAVELVPPVQREEGISSLATDEDEDLMALMSIEAGMRKPKQEQPTQTNEEVRLRYRTGTPPYMSIRVLGKSKAHCVHDDAESLFYVLYLFPFQHPLPAERYTYPSALPRSRVALPDAIKTWAGGWNRDLHSLGLFKRYFFQNYESVNDHIDWLVPLWKAANRLAELAGFQFLIQRLFKLYIRQHVDGGSPGDLDSLSSAVGTIVGIINRTDIENYDVPGVSGPLPMSSS